MIDIYLIPRKLKPFNINKKNIYIKDVYCIYPNEYEKSINNICLRSYDKNNLKYDVIHLGEIIQAIKNKLPEVHISFLKPEDTIIFFDNCKKDRSKYIRVFLVSVVVLLGSIMGIMNFHADVNMIESQLKLVNVITGDGKSYLSYFQVPYSLGIGLGVALFFNKFIPTYAKDEPSPMDLKMVSLNKEITNQLRDKDN
ncbi:hypothetical protein CHF27_012440 [Romboutsia maritimum]|uniref:Stage V sporulation protein AA domain-containing protein n=1 Tax=Romboutsia maritimum TaxID=2020948 RepID=A0A371IQ53_9FIRM|nr:stage V sporulation protein AA [Romboutsia maritimum]RDY22617.1 hypothetical protein CHF27_012440 [Romboutsia maritimum]